MKLSIGRLVHGMCTPLQSRVFIPAIAVVIGLNVIWLYSNFLKVKNLNSTAVLTNGSKMPRIVGMDIADNRKVGLDGNSWRLVIYCSEETLFDIAKAKYADILLKKYRDQNFSAIGIITADCPKLKRLAMERELSYSMILDEDKAIANSLGLRNHTHGVFVADPGGVIRFAATAPHVEEDDLRQLVEKFVLGKVTYLDDASNRAITEGKVLPSLVLQDLRSGELLTINDQVRRTYNTYVIFTADCPACSLSSYLQALYVLSKSAEAKQQRAMAIFSSRFSREQLLEEIGERKINTPLYLARGELAGFEDAYYLRSFTSQVVVLAIDGGGVIKSIQPINEYLATLRAPEAGK